MDRIAFELENQCARVKRRERYNKQNSARRRIRLKRIHLLFPELLIYGRNANIVHEQRPSMNMEIDPIRLLDSDDEHLDRSLIGDHHCSAEETDNRETSSVPREALDGTDSTCPTESVVSERTERVPARLHQHTFTLTLNYCETFMKLARRSNLPKSHTNDFLSFIESGLPVPNYMPTTEKKLLDLLEVKDLFTRRSVCLSCCRELDYQQRTCFHCHAGERSSIAHL